MRAGTSLAVTLAGWVCSVAAARAADERSFALEVLWSTPVSVNYLNRQPQSEPGSVFEAQAIGRDGHILFFGSRIIAAKRVLTLFADSEHNPSDDAVTLTLNGAHPQNLHLFSRLVGAEPRPLTLAVGPSGDIWLGGGSNRYEDLGGGSHSDAYLARIDTKGKIIWEKAYGNGGWRQIKSVASLPADEVIVAGEDAGKGWLALISSDGDQLWEHRLGIAKQNKVASLPGNRLVVAGFEATGSSSTGDYQEHISAWVVSRLGKILAQTRVRTAINTVSGSNYGHISLAATNDAIYIISNWTGFPHGQPIEVSKLDFDGKLLWTKSLPDNNAKWTPTLAVNQGGEALIAIAFDGRIHFYQFEQSSGSYREINLSMPNCSNGYPVTLFLAVRNDGTILMSGSPPELNSVPRCTWTGKLTEIVR